MVCPLLVTRNASDKLSRTQARGLEGSRALASRTQLLNRALKPIVASREGVLPSPRGKPHKPESFMISQRWRKKAEVREANKCARELEERENPIKLILLQVIEGGLFLFFLLR